MRTTPNYISITPKQIIIIIFFSEFFSNFPPFITENRLFCAPFPPLSMSQAGFGPTQNSYIQIKNDEDNTIVTQIQLVVKWTNKSVYKHELAKTTSIKQEQGFKRYTRRKSLKMKYHFIKMYVGLDWIPKLWFRFS